MPGALVFCRLRARGAVRPKHSRLESGTRCRAADGAWNLSPFLYGVFTLCGRSLGVSSGGQGALFVSRVCRGEMDQVEHQPVGHGMLSKQFADAKRVEHDAALPGSIDGGQ